MNGIFNRHGNFKYKPLTLRKYNKDCKAARAAIEAIQKTDLPNRQRSAVLGHLLELEDAIFCVRWNSQPSENPANFSPCRACSGKGEIWQLDCHQCKGAGIVRAQ